MMGNEEFLFQCLLSMQMTTLQKLHLDGSYVEEVLEF